VLLIFLKRQTALEIVLWVRFIITIVDNLEQNPNWKTNIIPFSDISISTLGF